MQEATRQAYRDDGAVVIRNCLDREQLARCRDAFDWAVENPGPMAFRVFEGTAQQSHNDNANPLAKSRWAAAGPAGSVAPGVSSALPGALFSGDSTPGRTTGLTLLLTPLGPPTGSMEPLALTAVAS